jgi:hypothetical protein
MKARKPISHIGDKFENFVAVKWDNKDPHKCKRCALASNNKCLAVPCFVFDNDGNDIIETLIWVNDETDGTK